MVQEHDIGDKIHIFIQKEREKLIENFNNLSIPEYCEIYYKAKSFDQNIFFHPYPEKKLKFVKVETQKKINTLFENLFPDKNYKKEQKLIDFSTLCYNLIYYYSKPIKISLNRNHYVSKRRKKTKKNYRNVSIKYRRVSYFIKDIIEVMENEGLIKVNRGHGNDNPELAKRTLIIGTNKFYEIFDYKISHKELKTAFILTPIDQIVLRDKDKREIDFRESPKTQHIRKMLKAINQNTDKALVQLIDPCSKQAYRLRTRLHIVFNNGNFNEGGRLYTSTEDGYQSCLKEERKYIHINAEKTVELDFSGMLIRMLYAIEGIQYNGDPYLLKHYEDVRDLVKIATITMINASDKTECIRSINKEIKDNFQLKREYYRLGVNVKRELVPLIMLKHHRISKYFFTGYGLKMQNLDGKIALHILYHFAKKDIPVLAIHDSFIIQEKYKNELREVMDKYYKKFLNDFSCPIKEES